MRAAAQRLIPGGRDRASGKPKATPAVRRVKTGKHRHPASSGFFSPRIVSAHGSSIRPTPASVSPCRLSKRCGRRLDLHASGMSSRRTERDDTKPRVKTLPLRHDEGGADCPVGRIGELDEQHQRRLTAPSPRSGSTMRATEQVSTARSRRTSYSRQRRVGVAGLTPSSQSVRN
jgi:hypothetical protein